MLVICEDCAKKYSIDEKRIKAPKVKFNCRACNHIIIVEKPKSTEESQQNISDLFSPSGQQEYINNPQEEYSLKGQRKEKNIDNFTAPTATVRAALRHSATASGKGAHFFVYLLTVMVIGFLLITAFFDYFYLNTIPGVLQNQLELRSLVLTESLQGSVMRSLSKKDYLRVNRKVKRASKLPGVAYAAISNEKGIVIAGFFNNLNKFENHFAQRVKEEGFKLDILIKNTIPPDEKWAGATVRIGGVPVYNQVASLPGTNGELHVGLYVDELDKHFFKVLFTPLTLTLLVLFFLSGYTLFMLLDKFITEPMRTLTNIANRISLGELDLAIMTAGPREVRDMAAALERMRHSIKVAMERLS